ncbi:hypothetical protein CL630_03845 [bacterium]|nr:hypothetical protein [bacterium]|tara:strand:- start:82 stop:390 length:309 start_codon:yes stop_codon:yes gene_type:complete
MDFHIKLQPAGFFHVIVTLLCCYEEQQMKLEDDEFEFRREVTGNILLIGGSIKLLIGDLYENEAFMNSLVEYCEVNKLSIKPAALISDIISGRLQEEHPEIN